MHKLKTKNGIQQKHLTDPIENATFPIKVKQENRNNKDADNDIRNFEEDRPCWAAGWAAGEITLVGSSKRK